MDEYNEIMQRVRTHFTPAELIDYLGISFETLFDSDDLVDIVFNHLDELAEEIGIDPNESD